MATDRAVIHQLLAIREIVDGLIATLAPAPEAVTACQHTAREDLTTFGGLEHWVCKQCGFEYREDDDAS
jgi:hypothetical protein